MPIPNTNSIIDILTLYILEINRLLFFKHKQKNNTISSAQTQFQMASCPAHKTALSQPASQPGVATTVRSIDDQRCEFPALS